MSAFQGSLQQVCSRWRGACLLIYRIICMRVTSQAAMLAGLFINGGDVSAGLPRVPVRSAGAAAGRGRKARGALHTIFQSAVDMFPHACTGTLSLAP